jgi:hypothetical protein
MFLPDSHLLDITELSRRIGMDGPATQVWLAEHGPTDLGEFNYRELIRFASMRSSYPQKTRMTIWQSVLSNWVGYAWERGDEDVAIHLIHTALAYVTKVTARKEWSRVLSALKPSGQLALGAYLKQVHANYWNGLHTNAPMHWRANMDAINESSRCNWVTASVLAAWSEQDIVRVLCSTVTSSFGRGILPVWLGQQTTSNGRWSFLLQQLAPVSEYSEVARGALIGNIAGFLIYAKEGLQKEFFDILCGNDTLAALRAVTQTRQTQISNVALEQQVPYLVKIYDRLGAEPWEVHLSIADRKRLRSDLQRQELWCSLAPTTKRNLVLLVLACGVEGDVLRAWAASALGEVNVDVGVIDIVATLGLQSWPTIIQMTKAETPTSNLPEILLS